MNPPKLHTECDLLQDGMSVRVCVKFHGLGGCKQQREGPD